MNKAIKTIVVIFVALLASCIAPYSTVAFAGDEGPIEHPDPPPSEIEQVNESIAADFGLGAQSNTEIYPVDSGTENIAASTINRDYVFASFETVIDGAYEPSTFSQLRTLLSGTVNFTADISVTGACNLIFVNTPDNDITLNFQGDISGVGGGTLNIYFLKGTAYRTVNVTFSGQVNSCHVNVYLSALNGGSPGSDFSLRGPAKLKLKCEGKLITSPLSVTSKGHAGNPAVLGIGSGHMGGDGGEVDFLSTAQLCSAVTLNSFGGPGGAAGVGGSAGGAGDGGDINVYVLNSVNGGSVSLTSRTGDGTNVPARCSAWFRYADDTAAFSISGGAGTKTSSGYYKGQTNFVINNGITTTLTKSNFVDPSGNGTNLHALASSVTGPHAKLTVSVQTSKTAVTISTPWQTQTLSPTLNVIQYTVTFGGTQPVSPNKTISTTPATIDIPLSDLLSSAGLINYQKPTVTTGIVISFDGMTVTVPLSPAITFWWVNKPLPASGTIMTKNKYASTGYVKVSGAATETKYVNDGADNGIYLSLNLNGNTEAEKGNILTYLGQGNLTDLTWQAGTQSPNTLSSGIGSCTNDPVTTGNSLFKVGAFVRTTGTTGPIPEGEAGILTVKYTDVLNTSGYKSSNVSMTMALDRTAPQLKLMTTAAAATFTPENATGSGNTFTITGGDLTVISGNVTSYTFAIVVWDNCIVASGITKDTILAYAGLTNTLSETTALSVTPTSLTSTDPRVKKFTVTVAVKSGHADILDNASVSCSADDSSCIGDNADNTVFRNASAAYTPATKILSASVVSQMTITELTYRITADGTADNTAFQFSFVYKGSSVKCEAYDIEVSTTAGASGIVPSLSTYGLGGTAKGDLRNLPATSALYMRITTKNGNDTATVGDWIPIGVDAFSSALGNAVALTADFSETKKTVTYSWDKSPLYVSSNVYIPQGCKLIVSGETTLSFDCPSFDVETGMLVAEGRKIIVEGALIVDGEIAAKPGSRAYITGFSDTNGTTKKYFSGIFVKTGGDIYLRKVDISYARMALFFENAGSLAVPTNSGSFTVSAFATAIGTTPDAVSYAWIDDVVISNCTGSIYFGATTNAPSASAAASYEAGVNAFFSAFLANGSTGKLRLDTLSTPQRTDSVIYLARFVGNAILSAIRTVGYNVALFVLQ